MKEGPGFVGGKHYSDWPDAVTALKRAGKVQHAERLLLSLVDATEAESMVNGGGVAPWFYEQLAIIYSKNNERHKEVAILERFANQPHAPGVKPAKLVERLAKARKKLNDGA